MTDIDREVKSILTTLADQAEAQRSIAANLTRKAPHAKTLIAMHERHARLLSLLYADVADGRLTELEAAS